LKIKLFLTDVLYWTVESCWAAENYPYFRRLCQIGPSKVVEPPEIGKISYSRARQAQRSLTHSLSLYSRARHHCRPAGPSKVVGPPKIGKFSYSRARQAQHLLTHSLSLCSRVTTAARLRLPPPGPAHTRPLPATTAGSSRTAVGGASCPHPPPPPPYRP
jgi:hypothetical protein